MEFIGRMVALYFIVLATESIIINLFYPQFPLLPGDYPLDKYGFSSRIPFFSSLLVAIVVSIFLANIPLSLFRVF